MIVAVAKTLHQIGKTPYSANVLTPYPSNVLTPYPANVLTPYPANVLTPYPANVLTPYPLTYDPVFMFIRHFFMTSATRYVISILHVLFRDIGLSLVYVASSETSDFIKITLEANRNDSNDDPMCRLDDDVDNLCFREPGD